MPVLYNSPPSGNCYKVRLMMALLGREYDRVDFDVREGLQRAEEHRKRNPAGRVPVLELDDGRFLPESNAILAYLAEGTEWFPSDPFERAQTLRWMFWEQNLHEPVIATARYWIKIAGNRNPEGVDVAELQERGLTALDTMERHLREHDWFGGSRATTADLALFAYTHVAGDAEFDLGAFPQVLAWIERVKEIPGYVTLEA